MVEVADNTPAECTAKCGLNITCTVSLSVLVCYVDWISADTK